MTRSQNGYSANNVLLTKNYSIVPNVTLRLRRGDTGWLLADLAQRIDAKVAKLGVKRDDWGYASRKIRGSATDVSNHASGTAMDLNSIQHALGKRNTWTREQEQTIHNLLEQYDGVIRWGGDYHGRVDEMHFEIVGTPAQVKRTADRIRKARKNKKTA